ncbi:MAG: phytanoyl-CoA dioxygenase family protein [Moorea sp. SIO4G2]|uniref:phytanoyl-CoA dioxygenase family protein n=2 Tax=unclassified Moorena TaxID=2683338 RepID=UPI0013FB6480|nr:phytanoyl-CoA dioxygenase family protein [Moorena sp. SIO4A1]NEO60665.1 phytanoyl-CoA dioxygenase family protein [Moorena sp. SIO4G2]NEQ62595.1 phytanoyl-CoA dioxygenase family protein [Moorena sp. SIO4A1]
MDSQMIASKFDTDVRKTHRLTQEQLTQYHEDGYVIVRGLFDSEEVSLIREVCDNDPNLANSLRTVINQKGEPWHAAVWNGLNDSLVSVVTRLTRIVDTAELILGEECYHWHSKIVQKLPYDDTVINWHQGYTYWYGDGCLFPNIVTCTVAITENTKAHGCLQVIKKSHLMGRIKPVLRGNGDVCDPKRMEKVIERLEVVDCEMAPGDAVFFHANTIHGSQGNHTDDTRILMHCHYNAVSNQPVEEKGQKSHPYILLDKLPDSAIKNGLYKSGFEDQTGDWNWYTSDFGANSQ